MKYLKLVVVLLKGKILNIFSSGQARPEYILQVFKTIWKFSYVKITSLLFETFHWNMNFYHPLELELKDLSRVLLYATKKDFYFQNFS